ncbi:MAG: selenocysteine-specific translation elongation factor [Chthoniobacterales bacterium]
MPVLRLVTQHFVIATAGHVDHGKSSLVKALTGTDPDRLPEEKARKITIDLGFAELKLPGPDGDEIHAAIVDVPGHEDFVRNMIAGVGSIDLALLVVAADDGWMPQTEEHLQILEYLGVTRAVIALTKIDIGDADKVDNAIREQLRATAFANAPIIHTTLGGSTAELKEALVSELSKIEPHRDTGKPRLPVDRAFTLRGVGTVVTGTLTGGTLRVGKGIVVQPRGRRSRIRSLQSHRRDLDVAYFGTRTAINLPDLAPDSGISRGDVVTIDGFEPTTAIAALVRRSPRLQRGAPLKSGASVYFHHGTRRMLAKIILLETDSLLAGSEGFAQLELSEPALVFVGDRFILRDGSEQHTIAGGRVLDLDVQRETFRSSASVKLLKSRAAGRDNDVDLYTKTELARRGPTASSQLLARSRFSDTDVATALQRLAQRGEIFLADDIAADRDLWRSFHERAIRLIDATHREHPERAGLELNEFRAALNEQPPEVVHALIVDLCRREFVRVGSTIARRSHRAALPTAMEPIAQTLREKLTVNPFDPPSRQQLAPDAPAQQALKFLIERKQIVEISDDVVLSNDAFEKMKTEIANFISSNGGATVSQLRGALKTSRRVMVPLLERLDRESFTRRIGDERTLAQQITRAKLSDAPIARRN